MRKQYLCKILQKRVYDLLSSRNSLLFCLTLAVVLIVASLHFGEVLLEWSRNKYFDLFIPFGNNIGGRSYQRELCQYLPIDAVYTWVNGSDPLLIEQLDRVRKEIIHKQNISSPSSSPSTSVSSLISEEKRCANQGDHYYFITTPIAWVTPFISDFPASLLSEDTQKPLRIEGGQGAGALFYFETLEKAGNASKREDFTWKGSEYKILPTFIRAKCGGNKKSRINPKADLPYSSTLWVSSLILLSTTGDSLPDQISLLKELSPRVGHLLNHISIDKNNRTAIISLKRSTPSLVDATAKHLNKTGLNRYSAEAPVELIVGDLEFQRLLHDPLQEEVSRKRFSDNDELKYSLRSLEKYAPWVRNVYIVTNGQIPHWLDLENPGVKIVQHKDIFPDKSHLPTFSSPAIESHLHLIPGLSKKFLYINDDIIFGKPIWPEDFYTHSQGFKVYLAWPVPNCEPGCPLTWVKDGFCDQVCNTSACMWDGGDCEGTKPGSTRLDFASKRGGQGHRVGPSPLPHCSRNCPDNWLGDKFCDKVCDNQKCAFDLGDCGVDRFGFFSRVDFAEEEQLYAISTRRGSPVYVNLTDLFKEKETVIEEAFYERQPSVRAIGINSKHKVLTALLVDNFSETNVSIELKYRRNNRTFDKQLMISVYAFSAENADKGADVANKTQFAPFPGTAVAIPSEAPAPQILITYQTFPDQDVYPKQLRLDASDHFDFDFDSSLLPINKTLDMERLLLREPAPQEFLMGQNGNETRVDVKEKPEPGSDGQVLRNGPSDITESIFQSTRNYGVFPWEKNGMFGDIETSIARVARAERYQTSSSHSRHLMDVYADSLRYVNRLYNNVFGIKVRKVPAHMAHFVDSDIVARLQATFPGHFEATSSHQIRSSRDMQFAFSYYYFLTSETQPPNASRLINNLDVDLSGSLSGNEVRTLMVTLLPLPLEAHAVADFVDNVRQCSGASEINVTSQEVYSLQVSREIRMEELVFCENITRRIDQYLGLQNANKYQLLGDEETAFKMIRSNSSLVARELDELQKKGKKFICLNDDVEDQESPEAKSVRALLVEFYESIVPQPSRFELLGGETNKCLHLDDYRERKKRSRLTFQRNIYCLFLPLIALFLVLSFCFRRRVQPFLCCCLFAKRKCFKRLPKNWV